MDKTRLITIRKIPLEVADSKFVVSECIGTYRKEDRAIKNGRL